MPIRATTAAAPPARSPRLPRDSMRLRERALEESRRSFLRMASHELRTPLNAIIGFAEIITRELYGPVGEPRYRDHAEIIRDSGLQLLKLVNDVLDYARLEAGATELDLGPEDAVCVAEEAMAVHALDAREKALRVVLAVERRPFHALADPRALKTVLCNLLSNAIVASPPGEVVEISIRQAGREVVLEVRDRGPGLAPADLQRALKPFDRSGDVLTRASGGAGLGLPIARLLCQGMGGKLQLRSRQGSGLSAQVRLPAAGLWRPEPAAPPYALEAGETEA